MMHYECASFEIFWILETIMFQGIFTFPPRRWFAPNNFRPPPAHHLQTPVLQVQQTSSDFLIILQSWRISSDHITRNNHNHVSRSKHSVPPWYSKLHPIVRVQTTTKMFPSQNTVPPCIVYGKELFHTLDFGKILNSLMSRTYSDVKIIVSFYS